MHDALSKISRLTFSAVSLIQLLSVHVTCSCFFCAGLMAPLYFKKAVDALATQTHVAAKAAVIALLWSGGCRVINGLAKEMQHPIFTPVAQVWPFMHHAKCASITTSSAWVTSQPECSMHANTSFQHHSNAPRRYLDMNFDGVFL